MSDELYDKWLVQFRKGFLELCVLRTLAKNRSAYGLQLLQLLERAELEVNEGTLYPLLNRMHKNGWLESSWEPPTDGGHPRRFYSLSDTGQDLLPRMLTSFETNAHSLELLEELT